MHLRGDLETIGGVAQIVRERARVVDQHVEPRYRPTDAVGEVPHVVEDREVRDRGRHAGIRCDGSDRAPGCFGALRVAADDPDVGVALRERRRRGEAETAGRARDQRDPAAHVDDGLGIPIEQRTACRESDAAEAADDRRFERGVGQPARTVEARHACTADETRPQAGRGAVADAVEDDREQRVGQPADALGVELRVVDHDGTVVVVFERDRVDGTDRAVLGSQHDPLVAVVLDDLVVEGYAPPEESGNETEPRADPDRLGREHLAGFDAGVPLSGAIEATEVGERSGPRDGDRNSCDVASHRPSPFRWRADFSTKLRSLSIRRSDSCRAMPPGCLAAPSLGRTDTGRALR